MPSSNTEAAPTEAQSSISQNSTASDSTSQPQIVIPTTTPVPGTSVLEIENATTTRPSKALFMTVGLPLIIGFTVIAVVFLIIYIAKKMQPSNPVSHLNPAIQAAEATPQESETRMTAFSTV